MIWGATSQREVEGAGSCSARVPVPGEGTGIVWHPGLVPEPGFFVSADSDDALLKMTITQQEFGRAGLPDLSSMTEEEQIAYAMQMSLQGAGGCLGTAPLSPNGALAAGQGPDLTGWLFKSSILLWQSLRRRRRPKWTAARPWTPPNPPR